MWTLLPYKAENEHATPEASGGLLTCTPKANIFTISLRRLQINIREDIESSVLFRFNPRVKVRPLVSSNPMP